MDIKNYHDNIEEEWKKVIERHDSKKFLNKWDSHEVLSVLSRMRDINKLDGNLNHPVSQMALKQFRRYDDNHSMQKILFSERAEEGLANVYEFVYSLK